MCDKSQPLCYEPASQISIQVLAHHALRPWKGQDTRTFHLKATGWWPTKTCKIFYNELIVSSVCTGSKFRPTLFPTTQHIQHLWHRRSSLYSWHIIRNVLFIRDTSFLTQFLWHRWCSPYSRHIIHGEPFVTQYLWRRWCCLYSWHGIHETVFMTQTVQLQRQADHLEVSEAIISAEGALMAAWGKSSYVFPAGVTKMQSKMMIF